MLPPTHGNGGAQCRLRRVGTCCPRGCFVGRMYARAVSGCLWVWDAWAASVCPTLPTVFYKDFRLPVPVSAALPARPSRRLLQTRNSRSNRCVQTRCANGGRAGRKAGANPDSRVAARSWRGRARLCPDAKRAARSVCRKPPAGLARRCLPSRALGRRAGGGAFRQGARHPVRHRR